MLTACGVLDNGRVKQNSGSGLVPCTLSVFTSLDWIRIHTERENGAVVLVHQSRVRVLDLVNVVKVFLRNSDLIGDITGNGWIYSQLLCFPRSFDSVMLTY